MKFKVYKNEKQLRNEEFYFNDQKIILIFHGLFGRAKNWHSTVLKLSSIVEGLFIVFDLRNHGENEPSTEISYSIMAKDVYEFIQSKNISKISIIGHSMGGKLGMLFSLLYPTFVKQLFVVDKEIISSEENPLSYFNLDESLIFTPVSSLSSRSAAISLVSHSSTPPAGHSQREHPTTGRLTLDIKMYFSSMTGKTTTCTA